MKVFFIIISLLINVTICRADALQPHTNKEWQFPFGDGVVKIALTEMKSTIDGQEIYSLQIINKKVEPTLQDETIFLKTVTQSMEKEGMSPQRITGIILELREPDVSKQLSTAASSSKIWTKAKKSEYGIAVVKLLNSIDAYAPFNQVFNQYGLEVEVGHAEYISLIKPEQIGLKNSTASVLPSSATLQLILVKSKP